MNSFKNSKYKNKRKGFSMVEMLAVVAIIAILTGLSAVGINKYRRSLKLIEMDGLAKEIYVATQNNLTMAYGQSYLGISDNNFGTKDVNENAGVLSTDEVYYYIVSSDYQFKESTAAESALDLMLPKGSIDSTVLSEGNLVIRYQKSTGTVIDVFYASSSEYSFSHTFTENDYAGLIYGTNNQNYRTESDLRKNYGDSKAVIGYCGNSEGISKSVDSDLNLSSPIVRGVNSDILYTVVTFPDTPTEKDKNGNEIKVYNEEKIITVTGEDGKKVTFKIDETTNVVTRIDPNGKETTFSLGDENSQLKKVTSKTGQQMPGDVTVPEGSYILILDDITTKNHHFTDLYPITEGWKPGENLTIQAEIKLSEKNSSVVSHSATSNKVTLNSLFGTKSEDSDSIDLTINNIRQLENLDPSISGFTPTEKVVIEQNSNIDFNDFVEELKKVTNNPEITQKGGNDDPSDSGTFAPIDINYQIEYDGNNHTIENIVVKTEGSAGIFGDIATESSEIKDLVIINPNIWSYDGNAGALVGTVTGTSKTNKKYFKISGVVAYNARPEGENSSWNDSNLKIHAAWNAGGLIGRAVQYVDVSACGAALYVESYPKDNEMSNMSDDNQFTCNAGGFAGRINKCIITGCYSGGHTVSGKYLSSYDGNGRVNVVGAKYSGGFVGLVKGTNTISCCYSTCSVGSGYSKTGAHSYIGGFSGLTEKDATLNYCYTVGRVVGSKASRSYGFTYSAYNFSGTNNYYLDGVSVNTSSRNDTSVVSSVSIESSNYNIVSYESSRQNANVYDDVLMVDSEGKYYFLTVDQLYEKYGVSGKSIDGITNVQFGDWQIPSSTITTSLFFKNDEKLELWIELRSIMDVGEGYLSVAIKGETSAKVRAFLFDVRNAVAGATISYTPGYIATNGEITWIRESVGSTKIPASIDESGTYLVITLDDVTTKGCHFYQLLGVKDGSAPALTVGENITAYAVSGVASNGADLYESSSDITNSLFDYGTNRQSGIQSINSVKTNVMYISNARHLQNMSTTISKLSTSIPGMAYLCADITWDAPFSNGIYSYNGSKVYDGFYGIVYNTLNLFDGQGHTLKNFKFANVAYSSKNYYSGLFLTLAGSASVEIRDFIILNPTVLADSSSKSGESVVAYAGALFAYVSGDVQLTIDTVAVIDNSTDSARNYAISVNGNNAENCYKAAGGLIGYLATSETSKTYIKNSSVSANIKAYSTGTGDTRTYAGGFIGKVSKGVLDIVDSYVGGHTYAGKYNSDIFTEWNIEASKAGGFIGANEVKNCNVTISIKNTFNTASVSGFTYAGSFVGRIDRPLVLENVYTTAPVEKAEKTGNTIGAIIGYVYDKSGYYGSVSATNVYYLPEAYNLKTLKLNGQLIGKGYSTTTLTGTIQEAYYDTTTGKVSSTSVSENVTIRKKDNTVVLTNPFDQTLIDSNKEYPFMCWTTSVDPSDNGALSFTGDWVVNGIEAAVAHKVTFYYINGDESTGILTAPKNNEKSFLSGNSADVIVPSMDSANPGCTATSWYVGDKINETTFNFTSWNKTAVSGYDEKTGLFTIPEEYTSNDCSIVVIYKSTGNSFTVDFRYDQSGKNDYSQANSGNIVKAGTPQIVTSLNKAVEPTCTISGMTFIGWFSDAACTKEIDFSSTAKLTENVIAYAKFGKKYTITINYLYNDNGTLKKLLSPAVKTYISTSDSLPTITLLDSASDVFLEAYTIGSLHKDSETGTKVTTTPSGKTATFQVENAQDTTYYAIYNPSAKSVDIYYTVNFIFAHTDSSWNYSASESNTMSYPTSGKYHATNAAALMNVGNVSFQDFFASQTISGTETKWSDYYMITGYTMPTSTSPVLTITVERRKFTLSADANTGAYIEPVEVECGMPLYDLLKNSVLTRNGYTFPTDFNSRWKYYKLGESSANAKVLTSSTVMPAYNTVLCANWIAGTSNYTVLFWFENANDVDYSYGGSITKTGTTGTQISTDDWKTLSSLSTGGSSHVHSTSCYEGTTTVAFTTEYESSGGACGGSSDKYWVVNGKKINESYYDPDNNVADGYVHEFKYEDGNTFKGIKIGSKWYVYNGSVASGSTATCTGNNTNWLTSDYKNYFTYSQSKSYLESSDSNGHETIDGDGTTVLNVYYSRNRYHFYVKYSGGNYSHTHTSVTGSCYTLSCGLTEHTHTEACLSCTLTEHTHGTGCVYTCGLTAHDHTSGCTCTQEVHTHTAACYHTHADCTLTCAHRDGVDHPIGCYFTSYKLASSLSGDQKKIYEALKSQFTSPKSGYEYYVLVDASCDDKEAYFFYLSGTWYLIDDAKSYNGNSASKKTGKVSNKNAYFYQSSVATELDCSHEHTDSCYSCGKTTTTIDCGKTPHTHSDSCCTIKKHTHVDACCKLTPHTHSDANNCYQNCTAVKHTHTDACYTLTCKYADCTATNGKNYLMILYAKYQQNISSEWEAKVNSLSKYIWWDDVTHNNGGKDYFNHYVYSIDIMPGQDLWFSDYSSGTSYATVNYYVEAIPGKTTSVKLGDKYFELYTTGKPKSGWDFTYSEEFYNILGFTQYAFKVRSGSVNYDPTDLTGYGISGTTNLYYTRNSYTLELWVDNAKYKSYSVKSDVVLDSYCSDASSTKPSYVPSDYVFGGWYLDKECTEPYVAGSVMPKSNYILYSKWLPPIKTVTFMLNDADGVYQTYKTVEVRKYSTLEGVITNKTTNEYLDEYNPTNLAYWYYLENGTEKRFIPQKQITDNMTLYASYANNSATSRVTVMYKYDGNIISSTETYNYTIGGLFAIASKTIDGYAITGWKQGENGTLQQESNASIVVSDTATDNVIVFEYKKDVKWSYTVIYKEYYRTISGTVQNVEIYSEYITSGSISTKTFKNLSQDATAIVECTMPAGYENYTFYKMKVDDTQIYDRTYEYLTYDESKTTRTVTFYICPDTSKISANDVNFTYDGENKVGNISSDSFGTLPTYGGKLVKNIAYHYTIDTDSVIHAGSYKVNVFVVLTVTKSSKDFNILLWQGSVKLIIDPVSIKLKSASATQSYSQSVLKNETVTTDTGADWKTAFCGTDYDYFKPVFTVDAFRMDAGVSTNSFIMQLTDDADEKLADDYLIETEFGTLTVEWSYKIVYKFRYRDNVDTDNVAEWTVDYGTIETTTESIVDAVISLDDMTYENCRLCYSYGGREFTLGNASSYTVNLSPESKKNYSDGPSELVVYIEPDVTLVENYIPSTSEKCTFDGKVHALSVASEFNDGLFEKYKPTDVSAAKLVLRTLYYSGANEYIESPLNADTYYTTTNIYLVVTKEDNTKKEYLLASDTTKTIKLTIEPLAVTVTSGKGSAYIDVDGSLVFNSDANVVTTSNALLTTSMFSVINADNGSLGIGTNTNGNYFTIKWNSDVNSDNFKVTRVYGELDLTWRVKISFYLRPENCSALTEDTFVNYSGLTFDRTGTAFLIKNSTKYIELSATKNTIATSDIAGMIPSSCNGYTVASDYSFNGVSYNFGTAMSPNVNVFGERGANAVCIYLSPKDTIIDTAITKAENFEYYKEDTTLKNVVLDGVTITDEFVYSYRIYKDSEGNTFDANNLTKGTIYTRYDYTYLQITIKNSSGVIKIYNYLLNYACDPNPYTYNGK